MVPVKAEGRFDKEGINKLRDKIEKKHGKTVEELYEVVVANVNSTITPEGEKKAFVRLSPEYKAVDVAIKLGIL